MQVSKLVACLSLKKWLWLSKPYISLWYDYLELILLTDFKNHINIGGKNHVAYADAELVEVFINRHYCKQHVDHEMIYFDMQCWNTDHAQN